MEVLTEPEPLERFHPDRHDQAVGVAISRRLFVRQVWAVGEPVGGEYAAGQIACEQQHEGRRGREERQESQAPTDRQRHFGEIDGTLASRHRRPVVAEQEGVLRPQKLEPADDESQKAVTHAADDEVRVLVRLVGIAMVGEVLRLVRGVGDHDQRRDQIATEIVEPLQSLAAAVDVAVGGLVQRRVRHIR